MADVGIGRPRRTQQDRRAATQQRVLEAVIECLVDHGYNGLTTSRVAERAGVSRGAQLQQYPTRERLVVAAVEYLFRRRVNELQDIAGNLSADIDRTEAALDLLWTQVSSPLFMAGLELSVAARTDPALRAALLPFHRGLRRVIGRVVSDLFGAPANEHPDFAEVVSLVLSTMQGDALQRLLRPTAGVRHQRHLLDRATRLLLSTD